MACVTAWYELSDRRHPWMIHWIRFHFLGLLFSVIRCNDVPNSIACNAAIKAPSEQQQFINGAWIVWKWLNDVQMMPCDASEMSAVCGHHYKIVKKNWEFRGDLMMSKGGHYQGRLGASTGHKVGKDGHIMLKKWPIYALMNISCSFYALIMP